MSTTGSEESPIRYVFKGRYGAAPSKAPTPAEPSHEDIDNFVREILGVLDSSDKPATNPQVLPNHNLM